MNIEGRNSVTEYLKSGKPVSKVIIQEGASRSGSGVKIFALIKDKGLPYTIVPKQAFNAIKKSGNPQGFIIITEDFKYTDEDELTAQADKAQNPLIVLLDGIQDPHNLGSIIRVCNCAGVNGIIIPKRRCVPVNETAIKVSSGAAFGINIAQTANINVMLEKLKQRGYWVYGADAGGENMYDVNFSGKMALVIGGEGEGIKRLTRENCDHIIAVPMYGSVNSLNASNACAVLVYHIKRQTSLKA